MGLRLSGSLETLSVVPDRIGEEADSLISAVVDGWQHAQAGRVDEARAAYVRADGFLPVELSVSPDLSVLRHNVGRASGLVTTVAPTEDCVVSFVLPETSAESLGRWGMTPPLIDGELLERNIRAFIEGFDPLHHSKNIVRDLPHVLVLSTGRCGTVSLLHLFARSGLIPYHTYWWLLSSSTRWEMMSRLMAGRFDGDRTALLWSATRAAEWLGAMSCNRPMIGLNHLDTIFAPVFAAIHKESKFVHIHRDADAVFKSFFTKNQWGGSQLRPMHSTFSPEFRFYMTDDDLPACIAWYIRFTEVFSQAVGRVVGPDRYLEVSSDRLFAQDRDEIARLLDFTGADIPIADAVEHFATRINEKAHKVTMSPIDLIEPRKIFRAALERLEDTGRL
ncbi:MAG: sulfotransferase [Hyphomicrobiales bacterium]|nr:sulfotransferase [Hyphomicrobiales bacterium]